jgi:L-threonylcarbamoyladenylate synthase
MPTIVTVDPAAVDEAALRDAVDALSRGLVVGFPTDTTYGLAVDPRNPAAVRRLYDLKGRRSTSALTLVAADLTQAERGAVFEAAERKLAGRWWPGPLTVIAPARPAIAREVLAGGDTVGVRVPDHAVARALARAFGFCITATSANRSGGEPANDAAEVLAALAGVDCVIDGGATRGGAPSTIVDARHDPPRLVRQGAIPWERVLKSLE